MFDHGKRIKALEDRKVTVRLPVAKCDGEPLLEDWFSASHVTALVSVQSAIQALADAVGVELIAIPGTQWGELTYVASARKKEA